jgi:septal ring factor EnvC (AmiA/AmiB activator)
MNFWLFLGIITFVANFSLHLLLVGSMGGALVAGLAALASAIATAFAVNSFRKQGMDLRVTNLRNQIRLLQRQRAEAYQTMADMATERERVDLALSFMQNQVKQYEPGGSIPKFTPQPQPPSPSWDLSLPVSEGNPLSVNQLSTVPEPSSSQNDPLNQFLATAHITKQKIITSLNQLQAELKQLNQEITEQRQTRDKLAHEIDALIQQRQELVESANDLQADLDELEKYRVELDQYLAYVEAKKQELENGSNPLQKALKELQDQSVTLQDELDSLEQKINARRVEQGLLDQEISHLKQQQQMATQIKQEKLVPLQQELQKLEAKIKPLQTEVQKLETQIQNRRQEKEMLVREITQLQAQKSSLRHQSPAPEAFPPTPLPESQRPNLNRPSPKTKQNYAEKKQSGVDDEGAKHNGKGSLEQVSQGLGDNRLWENQIQRIPVWQDSVQPVLGEIQGDDFSDSSVQELSDLWADFMIQLPEYEFQALKAIALENNPMSVVDRIAEINFTTSGELIDAINQRATDIVGEEVIHFRSGFAPPAIARTHQRMIKKLIETYEYLTE